MSYDTLEMHISNVNICNFKAIKELELHFEKGVNLIIGDNGVGKTSVMEALALSFTVILSGIKGIKRQGIRQNDIRCSLSNGLHFFGKTSIGAEMVCSDGNVFQWAMYRDDGMPGTKFMNDRRIADYMKQAPMLPVLCYLGADRTCDKPKTIEDWCLKMETENYRNEGLSSNSYSWFLNAIELFLETIDPQNKNIEVYYSRDEGLAIRTQNEDIPISLLGAGYQSMLHIVMDIASRIALLNPDRSEYEKAPGVVVIDEIETHLHPKWQWNIVNALSKVFPNIQFILTTHSPIIISSCSHGNLISIGKNREVTYRETNYAYSIQDVVEYAQGSLGIPVELRKLVLEFDSAFNTNNHDSASTILREMALLYGEQNTEVQKASRKMRIWGNFQ